MLHVLLLQRIVIVHYALCVPSAAQGDLLPVPFLCWLWFLCQHLRGRPLGMSPPGPRPKTPCSRIRRLVVVTKRQPPRGPRLHRAQQTTRCDQAPLLHVAITLAIAQSLAMSEAFHCGARIKDTVELGLVCCALTPHASHPWGGGWGWGVGASRWQDAWACCLCAYARILDVLASTSASKECANPLNAHSFAAFCPLPFRSPSLRTCTLSCENCDARYLTPRPAFGTRMCPCR